MIGSDVARFLGDLEATGPVSTALERHLTATGANLENVVSFAQRVGYAFELPDLKEALTEKQARLDLLARSKSGPTSAAEEQRMVDQRWSAFGNPKPDGICGAPWTNVRIDAFDKTSLCCGFFEKLPSFDWPTAKEFHDPKRMWNHPILQNMRQGMGKSGELPFCSYCQGRYPHGSSRRDARKLSTKESTEVFDDILHRTSGLPFNGALDAAPEDLTTISLVVSRAGKTIAPFRQSKSAYRREVRRKGFWRAGRTLLIGGRMRDYAPFLSEAGNEVVVVDCSARQLHMTQRLMEEFGATCSATVLCEGFDLAALRSERFDAVWVDGRAPLEVGYTRFFGGLRAIMRSGARLRMKHATGIGTIVAHAVAEAEKGFVVPDVEAAFLAQSSLPSALKKVGFIVDKERPFESRLVGGFYREGVSPLGSDASAILARLHDKEFLKKLRSDPNMTRGLETVVSFCAIAVGD